MRKKAAHTQRLWRRLASWQRVAIAASAIILMLVQLGGSSAAVSATPDEVGQWSAPVSWPLVAVNLVLQPNGKVLAWDGWDDAPNSERLWDPASGAFFPVPYGRNLFCAGAAQLDDGRTLILGGHVNANFGLFDATVFDSQTNTYFRAPDMSVRRWYPTVTALPDGRTLVFAGDNIVENRPGATPPFSDASVNSLPEIYNPETNAWTALTSASLTTPLYPFMFVLSDGRVLDAGPDTVTRALNVGSGTWTTIGSSPFDGMSAVMYRPNKIMKSGTWATPEADGIPPEYNAHGRTAVLDMNAPSPAWRETAPMAHGRAYQNLTVLPDGTVLVSGGMSTSDGVDITQAVLPAEIWNPDTETWTTVASLQNGREYHSTAILLPDGRVLMAGGGSLPGSAAVDQRNAEIYSPPYLFKGPRPTISSAPAGASYGSSFDVTTPDAAQITKVSMIRLGAMTHGFDQNQRFQFLSFTPGAGKVTVQTPASADLAPPGDYLLFLVNANGVPSVGSFIRVSATGDTTPPTAPTGLAATATPGEVALSWGASSDAGGVANYNVHRSTTSGFTASAANRVAQPTGLGYTDTGRPAGTYYYKVTADDTSGNTSAASNEAVAIVPSGPPPGLVAAYGFDAGSGTTASDQSGTGNTGTLTNATWSTGGRYGGALSFNGTNAFVSVPDANSLDLTTGMTLEAWVRPSGGSDYRTVVVKERTGNIDYGLYSNSDTNRPESQVRVGGTSRLLAGTGSLPTGAWTHVAATYDGTTQRLYVNGGQVAQLTVSGSISASASPLKIGGNAIWGEYFNGLIDEVRVYNRALSAAEISADMNTAISNPDSSPPGAPGTLAATGGLSQVSLSWGPATDNTGVTRYNVHRSTTSGFTPSTANRIAQPTGTSYSDSGLAAGTYYYRVTAEDSAGNVGPASNEASGTATADSSAPTEPTSLTAGVAGSTVNLTWAAATDNVAVTRYNVHRGTSSGFTPSTANRIAQPTGLSYADGGLAAATYYYKVTAEDAAGNVGPASNQANAMITAAPPSGLVAAYGFDAGSGTTASDQSGTGNTGTLTNATWSTGGRYGGALSFNGTNAFVSVPDANSLDLTTGMTLEAWVRPTALGNAYRTVVMKERPGSHSYALYANGSGSSRAPSGEIYSGGFRTAVGSTQLATNTWAHVAATFNGAALTVYVGGVQTAQTPYSGSVLTGTGALKIGGNAIWGEYFNGLIDEVRVYNRALSAAEISADMNTAISNPDSSPPGAPGTLAATGGLSQVSLSWGPATDNTGVTRYNVHRSTTSGFTPSTANRIAQPTGTSYSDSGLAAGTYYYRVTAEDSAGNVGPASNEASGIATSGDSTSPTAPVGLNTVVSGSTVNLFWTAASDNVAVTRYNVHRGTSSGFTPSTANRIAQPTGLSYADGGLAAATYYYKVTAEDAAGNVGPASNEAAATVAGDTSAPTAPTALTAGVVGTTANLTWTAATDNIGVTRYNVHRSTTSGFTPSTANRIAQPTGTSYSDSGLAAGTYYYKVTAEDAAGNVGPASNEASAAVTVDTTPPTVSMTAPPSGAVVSASTNVTATASDNASVAGVQFKLDGANLGAEDTSAPYSVVWDTFGSPNGPHSLSAVARDGAGNTTTSTSLPVTVQNTTSVGLVGAWAFDEASGATAADQSGKGNNGTQSNATWISSGKFNNALSFNGTNAWVTVPDAATLDLTTGMTVEAWVRPAATSDWRTVAAKEASGGLAYGLYTNTDTNRPQVEVLIGGTTRSVTGPSALPTASWSHLGATYDGTTLRLYVNGAQVAQLAVSGSVATSSLPLRIGGNNVWGGEWFSGTIDEVRIYDRALSAAEIQGDMTRSVTPDTSPPIVTSRTPLPGAAGVNAGASATATFSEPMNAGTITGSTFQLKDASAALVPANLTYNATTNVATLTPQAALQYGATYTASVKGGTGGVTDLAGNPLAADVSWSYTIEASPPQVLVVSSAANPFGAYVGEILRSEGLNAFTTIDVSFLTPAFLTGFDVVVLGETTLTTTQVTTLTNWVTGGGNLVAMRPDKKLAGLLGLTDAGTTLANAYLQVDTSASPGAGIVGSTIQFHGSADRYLLAGATAVATLYSNATTATTNPAVTLRSVGSSGGQAAAFTYDLARSVVYTRQGNPAWASQERDGAPGIRPDDLFYGAKAGDVQPDWLDTNKIAIPQADEQQRLLLNLITLMERDKLPLPRFWYLPRGLKAAVVMSGDDHAPGSAPGGTASHFNRFKALSPAGCVVANWECLRSTSYIYPNNPLTNSQAAGYLADGFEIGLHPLVSSCPTTVLTESALSTLFDTQLGSFGAKYTSLPAPVSSRTHCVYWPDWASSAKVELAHGIRMDGNYYHFPAGWIGAKPGFLNGGGFPMRFADLDGTPIDVYQQNTNMDDEASQAYPATVNTLLDNALGPLGYYGAFGTNMHTDDPAPYAPAEAIIASAQARGVPVISYKQLLDWTDGRNNSTIRALSWNADTLTFTTTVAAGANGLQTMLPIQGPAGTLSTVTSNGNPVPFTVQTIKGIQYALFGAVNATYQATYG